MNLEDFSPGELACLDREIADARNEMGLTVEAVRQQLLLDGDADPTLMQVYLIREFYRIDKTKLTMLFVQAMLQIAEASNEDDT